MKRVPDNRLDVDDGNKKQKKKPLTMGTRIVRREFRARYIRLKQYRSVRYNFTKLILHFFFFLRRNNTLWRKTKKNNAILLFILHSKTVLAMGANPDLPWFEIQDFGFENPEF